MDFEANLTVATTYLSTHDPVLAPLIKNFGLPTFRPHNNYYQELVESIISQQLSLKAAATITARFVDLFGHFPTADEILYADNERLRSVGLSGRKTSYMRDLARRTVAGQLQFEQIDALSNDDIIHELTAVKGIGVWTAHMFLIFCMGRLDILPAGDMGIRKGITHLYKFDHLVNYAEIEQVSIHNHWHPYQSVASWYVWRSLEV